MLRNKRILILQQRGWALRVGHPLAVRLVREEGAVVGAVTVKRATHDFICSQQDIDYESVISADDVKGDPTVMADIATVTLTDVCRGLGVDTVWQMAQASRNHVHSYEDRYYYGFRQGQPDAEIVNFIKGTFLHVCRCFDEFRPDIVVLPNFAGLQHIMFSKLAEARGIPLFAAIDSKVKDVAVFAHDYLAQRSNYLERVAELRAGVSSANLRRARDYITENRKTLSATTVNTQMATRVFGEVVKRQGDGMESIANNTVGAREYLRAFRKSLLECYGFYRRGKREKFSNLGVTIDYRPPQTIFRDNFSMIRFRRSAEQFAYEDFSRIGKFIYFPLQVQPEATINVQAPLYTNQIETARQVAMAAPHDLTVVVKDHPNMSWRRPPSYLEKLARIPNVKLVDFRLRTEQILDRCALVISPSSSTIAEAALLRIPAIQFGGLGTTTVYPNVSVHADFQTLPQVIRRSLENRVDEDQYDAALAQCIAAAYDVGLEACYYELWTAEKERDVSVEDRERVLNWFVAEIKRLASVNVLQEHDT